jgi:hypothetical protein
VAVRLDLNSIVRPGTGREAETNRPSNPLDAKCKLQKPLNYVYLALAGSGSIGSPRGNADMLRGYCLPPFRTDSPLRD